MNCTWHRSEVSYFSTFLPSTNCRLVFCAAYYAPTPHPTTTTPSALSLARRARHPHEESAQLMPGCVQAVLASKPVPCNSGGRACMVLQMARSDLQMSKVVALSRPVEICIGQYMVDLKCLMDKKWRA